MLIRNLETQVSQLDTIGRLEAQGSSKLPFQTVINPKENVSSITLRGGKQLDEMPRKAKEAHGETKQQKDSFVEKDEATTPIESVEPPQRSLRIIFHQLFYLYHFLAILQRLKKKKMRRRS